jgi:uncharacterized membrane protein (DUF2068 family)
MNEEEQSRPQPGVAAIGLYMFLLCVLWLVPISRGQMPKAMLILCAAFAFAGQGLLRQKRWGWAMALAAIFLSSIQQVFRIARYHELPMLAGAAVNLIMFLYLVRPEVRERMR